MNIARLVRKIYGRARSRHATHSKPEHLNTTPKIVAQPRCDLPYRVVIATHHKTGTNWLRSIFEEICKQYSLRFFYGTQTDLPAQYDVFFQDHSDLDFDGLDKPYRGLHIIRDPRDVIVSGCFYHQKSKEEWLHCPNKSFQGLTYQEALNRCATLDEKILFEMENCSKDTIHDMMQWNYALPTFLELKYEDLISDTDLKLFENVFSFTGFPPSTLPRLLSIAYENSLFSGRVNNPGHVRSGEARQWVNYFKSHHKDRFLELFGDALITLGYEKDHDWATCEERSSEPPARQSANLDE